MGTGSQTQRCRRRRGILGNSVSISGDTALVAAWGADGGGSDGPGAAYVFYRDQDGTNMWGQVAKLPPLMAQREKISVFPFRLVGT